MTFDRERLRHRHQRLTRGGLGLLVAALLAGGWYRVASRPASSDTRALEAAAHLSRYVHPSQGVYALALQSRVGVEGEGPLAEFRLTGELGLRQEDASDAELWQADFEGSFQTFDGQATAADSARVIEAELRRPWRLRIDEAGHVADVEVAAGISPFTAQLWKSIAYSVQFVSVTPPIAKWQTEERDTVGVYVAEYETNAGDEDGDSSGVRKTKLRYLQTEGSALQAQYHIERATQLFRFARDGRWLGLDQAEVLRIDGIGGLPGFSSSSELHLTATTPKESATSSPDAGGPTTSYESALSPRDPRDLLGPARLQGLPWGEALARLRRFATTPEPDDAHRKQAARAYLALTEHLRRDPTRVAIAERAVLAGGPLTQTWMEALRDADTPESHTALVNLTGTASLEPARRLRAVRALSHVRSPSRHTVSALQALAKDPRLGRQATYGLGSSIYRLREREPELAASTVTQLAAELESRHDVSHQIKILIALGNAGHPVALHAARARLEHPSERLRAAAQQALRRVEDEEADALLARGLADPSPRVRKSALDALAERPPREPALHAVNALLVGESDPGVRAHALNLGIRWVERAPVLIAGLEHVSEHDSIPSLRQTATRALATRSRP